MRGVGGDRDVVRSAGGISGQREGMAEMDVDWRGNANLVEEAKRSGVKRFICV